MKKALLTFFIFFTVITTCYPAQALGFSDNNSIIISGYDNYAPLGYQGKDNKFHTAFAPIIDVIVQQIKLQPVVKMYKTSDLEAIERDIRIGKMDIFLGGYNQTDRFENLDLIFPAIAYNPITFFMLPSKAPSVNNIDDLKKLKGIRYSQEIFTDFIEEKIKDYNLENAASPYELFEKLFTHQVDYIISGYYFGMIEAIKLGVSHQISVSKTPLWNIPLFIGIVKISPRHDMLIKGIVRYLKDEDFINHIKDNFKKILESFEHEYAGVVPPTFGMENAAENFDTSIQSTPITPLKNISAE